MTTGGSVCNITVVLVGRLRPVGIFFRFNTPQYPFTLTHHLLIP